MDKSPFQVTRYPQGTFSWVDLGSTDAAASKTFLTELMGWQTVDIPFGEAAHEVYTMFTLDGENVAALTQLSPEMMEQGIPSAWTHYITVDDVDAQVPRINELGGQVLYGPMDVFEAGRMILVQDPVGAFVALWQPRSHIGASLVNRPGAMAWNELNTPDSAASQAFYGALFGWEFAPAGPPGYMMIQNQGRSNGGILPMDESWRQPDGSMIPSHWSVYFSVADLDSALEKVKALGGEWIHDVMEASGVGRFHVVREPSGAYFVLIQLNEPEPWPE